MSDKHKIIIYQTVDGLTKIDVRMGGETLWLSQTQIAQLFWRERSVVTKLIRNIFVEGELEEKSNVQNLHIPNSDKTVVFYNLDVILVVRRGAFLLLLSQILRKVLTMFAGNI